MKLFKKTLYMGLLALTIFGCKKMEIPQSEKEIQPEFNSTPSSLSEDESFALLSSQTTKEFIEVRNLLMSKIDSAINNGVSQETMRLALIASAQGDESQISSLLFSSQEVYSAFMSNYQAKNSAFLEQSTIFNNTDLFACGYDVENSINLAFSNYSTIIANPLQVLNGINMNISNQINGAVPTCGSYWNQVKLLACAGMVGASTAGVGAVLGAWGCWCTFCSQNSQVASVIC